MFLRSLRRLLVAAVSVVAFSSYAGQDCGFIPTSSVNEAFAEFGPWRPMVGGAVGACSFASDPRAAPNSLSVMQQFKSSKAEANRVYDAMRQGLVGNVAAKNVRDVKALGDRAFRYETTTAGEKASRMVSITSQKGPLVMTVLLSLQRPVTDADVQAATKLGELALLGANDATTQREASTCPWLDAGGLKRLFGGRRHEVQVHGEYSCMASDARARVLVVSVLPVRDEGALKAMLSKDCQSREVPELGAGAMLTFACKKGNPRAEASFVQNGRMFRLTWTSASAEPREEEKAALIELANGARALQAAR